MLDHNQITDDLLGQSMTITSSMRGGFLDHPPTRAELMSLVFGGK